MRRIERVERPRVTIVQAGGGRLIARRDPLKTRDVLCLRFGRRSQPREGRQKPHVPVEFYE